MPESVLTALSIDVLSTLSTTSPLLMKHLLKVSYDITIDPDRKLWFRVFVPDVTIDTTLPVIVYYHGGGFVFFSPNSSFYDELGRRLASSIPAFVISANYRLTPENQYPSQYDDGIDVLKFLDEDKSRKNLPDI